MKKHDFYYDLPNELIAQTPIEPRDASRMMVVNRQTGEIEHKHFYDVVDYLNPGDCLILNDTKVLPARLYGIKDETGAKVEFLLLMQKEKDVWEVITGPGKKAKTGSKFTFNDGILYAEITAVLDNGDRIAKFTYDTDKFGNFFEVLDKIGEMPLPPYIHEKLADQSRYQTVYAKNEGSAAAPTAGLHFTPELLERIRAKGVTIVPVTLHVGLGTFRPVQVEDVDKHVMHSEWYQVTEEAANTLNAIRAGGGRLICVGTTSVRTIETVATEDGIVHPGAGDTAIFIYPGKKIKAVDALITNFHLPQSTLLMLVSTFMGRETALDVYREAVQKKYRFFSFGDAMFIE